VTARRDGLIAIAAGFRFYGHYWMQVLTPLVLLAAPVIAAWNGAFRCVTTSLLGYGATAERRTDGDPSITHEADIVESVARCSGRWLLAVACHV